MPTAVRATSAGAIAAGHDVAFNAIGPNSKVTYIANLRLDGGDASKYTLEGIEPPPVGVFTERHAEAMALVDSIRSASDKPSGVVSLEGMGGTGKTSLAAHCLAMPEISDLFPAGIYWLTVGRDRSGERLSSYFCDAIQALSGQHFAATDVDIAAAGLIDCLASRQGSCLLVVDDVWGNDQLQPLLRGGSSVTRLVISRNRLGALKAAPSVELGMMTLPQAKTTLLNGLGSVEVSGLAEPLITKLAQFSRGWPVLLAILSAALRSNMSSGASMAEVAAWTGRLLERGGPAALDNSLPETIAQSVDATIQSTLELVDPHCRQLYAALCVFGEDAVVPDHLIASYWWGLLRVPEEEVRLYLSRLTQLRLISLRWTNGSPGRLMHDVLRDYLLHRHSSEDLVALNTVLIRAWEDTLLEPLQGGQWWHVSPAEQFVYEHLARHLLHARLFEERAQLLTDLRWLAAQISSLGSVISTVADLRSSKEPAHGALVRMLERHGAVLQRESSPGGLASTLLSRASLTPGLAETAAKYEAELEWPILKSCWTLEDLAPEDVSGHVGPIGDIAISPDGKFLASASDDRLALIWDRHGRSILHRLVGHSERVRSCSFSPKGDLLLTSGMDGTARLWSVLTGEPRFMMGRENHALLGSCWSPDSELVAGSFSDGRTIVWRATDGDVLADIKTEATGGTWDCEFVGQDHLLTVGDDGNLRQWHILDRECVLDVDVHKSRIRRCSVSRDSARALTAGSDGTVGMVRLVTGAVEGYLIGHDDRIRSAVFSSDDRYVLTASEDRSVRLWTASGLSEIAVASGHTDWVGRAIFGEGTQEILSAGGDATIRIWNIRRPGVSAAKGEEETTEVHRYERGGNDTVSCCFSPDGEVVFFGKVNHVRGRAINGEVVGDFAGHLGRVLDVTADEEHLYSSGSDGIVKAWRCATGAVEASVRLDTRIWSLDTGSDSENLVSAAEDGRVRLHSKKSLTVLKSSDKMRGHVMACMISPDKSSLSFAGDDGHMHIGPLNEFPLGQVLVPVPNFRSIWSSCYSHDGSFLAVAGEPADQTLILEVGTWKVRSELNSRVGRVTSVSFSLDDKLVATCGDDGYIGIWDAATGDSITGLRMHYPLRRCSWSPSEPRLLAVAGLGGEYLLRLKIVSS